LGAKVVEMSSHESHSRLPGGRAWAGLFVSPAIWAAHHQLGSNLSFAACDRAPDWVALAAGVAGIIVIAILGVLAFRYWRAAGGMTAGEAEALDVFVPLLSVMAATIFGLTIFVQLLADVILPSCFR
jgi:hypothetical protein